MTFKNKTTWQLPATGENVYFYYSLLMKPIPLRSLFLFAVANLLLQTFSFAQNIAAGFFHTLAVCPDSTVWAWGEGYKGALGDGANTNSPVPVHTASLTAITAVAAGGDMSFAIKRDGTLWGWGNNFQGQIGDGTNTNQSTPVQIISMGVSSVACGDAYTLAVKNDTAWAWGYNLFGQLGDSTTTNKNVPIKVHGQNNIGFFSGISSVSGEEGHSLALKKDSTVWAWGLGTSGQLGNGNASNSLTPVQTSSLLSIIAIAAGGYHNLVLKKDGTVWAYGRNAEGQIGDGTNTNRNIPVQVTGLTNIIAIAAGYQFSLALKNDGTVWAWGENSVGQLGDGTKTNRNKPIQVNSLTGIKFIECGGWFSLDLKNDGTLWAWGQGSSGQLGNGSLNDTTLPVKVINLCNMASVTEQSFLKQKWDFIFENIVTDNILKGIISIPENNALQVDIMDVQGRKVVNKEINCNAGTNVFQMNLNNIESGIYFINIYNNYNGIRRKFIKI